MNIFKYKYNAKMEPPRRPNDAPERQKEAASNVDMQMVDDMTLLSVVTILFAFFHYFTRMNAPQCTC
jgi:hypothetical protein